MKIMPMDISAKDSVGDASVERNTGKVTNATSWQCLLVFLVASLNGIYITYYVAQEKHLDQGSATYSPQGECGP